MVKDRIASKEGKGTTTKTPKRLKLPRTATKGQDTQKNAANSVGESDYSSEFGRRSNSVFGPSPF